MTGFLILLLHVLISPFKTQARLEAEIVLLRHQLNVLRQRAPSKPRLAVADRLLFVWLYRLLPSVLNTVTANRRPSSGGIVWASDCIGAGSHAREVGGRKFRWRSAH